MSNDALNDFLVRLDRDGNLREELQALKGGGEISAQDVVEFAAGKGYQFTVEDISGGELSEEALDAVAGGVGMLLPAVQKIYLGPSQFVEGVFKF